MTDVKEKRFAEEAMRAHKILEDALYWQPPWTLVESVKRVTLMLMNAIKAEGYTITIEKSEGKAVQDE